MLESRFWGKVDKRGPDVCWPWLASKTPAGYGHFQHEGKTVYAHRYSYEQLIDSIPNGFTIAHLCFNRGCINPSHMETVTQGVNVLRGTGACAVNAHKTHCPKGHPYAGGNLYFSSIGGRRCRICSRESQRRYSTVNL